MKRRRKALLLILAAVFFAGSIAAAYAAVETQTGIKNTVSTGGISIDIDTFTVKDGSTVPLEGKTVIDRDNASTIYSKNPKQCRRLLYQSERFCSICI